MPAEKTTNMYPWLSWEYFGSITSEKGGCSSVGDKEAVSLVLGELPGVNWSFPIYITWNSLFT